MKTKMKTLLLLPFFALLLFTSCQQELIDITEPTQEEALVASSELTSMISATSKMDGSEDNIIDKASCLSIKLPVKVVVNGIEIIINSREDYKLIKALYDKYEDDIDNLDIIFPIKIISSEHEEMVINNKEELENLVKDCRGEDEEDES